MKLNDLLTRKTIIGMVHCLPLPGTRNYSGSMQQIIDRAVADATILEAAGVDALIVENTNDSPVAIDLDTEQTTALTVISSNVKNNISIPVGIDAAFCDYKAGLAIAYAIDADFIRVPVFTDTIVTSAGIIFPCAREVIKYRKALEAENILLFCDVQVKSSYPLVHNLPLEDSALMAQSNGADTIIVTGSRTGVSSSTEELDRVKQIAKIPVFSGSGLNLDNVTSILEIADGAIVGSALKKDGLLINPIDKEKTLQLMEILKRFDA